MKQLIIDTQAQKIKLYHQGKCTQHFPISTALKGLGEIIGSEQTPRGWHIIRAKIGQNSSINTVYKGRRTTGEIYNADLDSFYPNRDWILTRIIWLSGLERGKNRLGNCDTMRRYIYIHGTPDKNQMGIPGSHGCIRMRNEDIIDLFDKVEVGTRVFITY